MKRALLWILPVMAAVTFLSPRALNHLCLRRLTGTTGEFHSHRFGQFEVRNLVRTNLSAGSSLITADVPSLTVRYDPVSVLRRQLHVYDISCEVRQLSITRRSALPGATERQNRARKRAPAFRIDVLHLKLDGTFSYEKQSITGKMETTLHDVRDVEAFRALLKKP